MELWNCLKPATKGDTFVQCSTCQTELLCAHGGRFDCKCHIETKGHLLFIYLKVLTNLKQITNPWRNYVAMLLKLVTIYILWDVYVIWMWIDWYQKYQPAEPENEVCLRVSEANESQTSYSIEQADIFQYQSYSLSDDMFIILKSNINTDTSIFVFSRGKLHDSKYSKDASPKP